MTASLNINKSLPYHVFTGHSLQPIACKISEDEKTLITSGGYFFFLIFKVYIQKNY